MTIEFLVLGPTQVLVDGSPVDLGGPKARSLLAVLIVAANRATSVDRLLDLLWEEPPATAVKNIQVHVSRIRQALGSEADRIVTTRSGYLLRADGETDLQRFDQLMAQATGCLETDPATAVAHLRSALSLWRGAPLEDITAEPVARALVPALQERHIAALEMRIAADLAQGRHAEVVGELRDLVGRHGLREQLHAQLMLALYRCGRQAEALEVYVELRRHLADELGLEPSPQLRDVHAAVLKQDRSLERRPHAIGHPATAGDISTAVEDRDRPRRRWGVAAVAAVALLVLVTALLVSDRHAAKVPAVAADSVAVINARGRVIADVQVGSVPGPITSAGGAVWVGDIGVRTLLRLDVHSRRVDKTFGLSAAPTTLTGSGDVVWVTNGFRGTLARVLTAYDQLSAPFFPAQPVEGLVAVAATRDELWTGLADGTLLRLDPTNLRVTLTSHLGRHPRAIALVGHDAWVIDFTSTDVRHVDGSTGVVGTAVSLDASPVAVAVGDGSVWVATNGDERLWRLSQRTGQVQTSIPLGVYAEGIVVGRDAVWIAAGDSNELVRVDPHNNNIASTVRLSHPVRAIAAVGDELWVTIAS